MERRCSIAGCRKGGSGVSRHGRTHRQALPAGVEFGTLCEVGELIRGRRFTKADYVTEGLGSIHYGEVYTEYGTWATGVRAYVRPGLKGNLRLAPR